METFDVIVVGGGPGGLTCATALARGRRRVLLLERNRRIGPKVCAGGVTWSGLIRRIPEELVEKSFPTQKIVSAWQKTIISEGDFPMVATVDRKRLGGWMAEEAQKAGVVIRTGEMVRAITPRSVRTCAREATYQFLVGADGSGSMVRRYLKLESRCWGMGVHYMVAGAFEEMEWHLDPGIFGSGYAWIFPHEKSVSVGAYAGRGAMTALHLQKNLRRWAEKRGVDLAGAKPEAAVVNHDFRGWRFGNIFLVGDAAGLASPLTGEGIYSATLSGEAVANVILGRMEGSAMLDRLIKKHERHRLIHNLTTRHKITGKMILELLIMALRCRLLHFSVLEMGE